MDKQVYAPQMRLLAETTVDGAWRMIGLANHAAALGIDIRSVSWVARTVTLQLTSRGGVDRLAAETGCDETEWGDLMIGSDGAPKRLYYRKAPGLRIYAGVPVDVSEATS